MEEVKFTYNKFKILEDSQGLYVLDSRSGEIVHSAKDLKEVAKFFEEQWSVEVTTESLFKAWLIKDTSRLDVLKNIMFEDLVFKFQGRALLHWEYCDNKRKVISIHIDT